MGSGVVKIYYLLHLLADIQWYVALSLKMGAITVKSEID